MTLAKWPSSKIKYNLVTSWSPHKMKYETNESDKAQRSHITHSTSQHTKTPPKRTIHNIHSTTDIPTQASATTTSTIL